MNRSNFSQLASGAVRSEEANPRRGRIIILILRLNLWNLHPGLAGYAAYDELAKSTQFAYPPAEVAPAWHADRGSPAGGGRFRGRPGRTAGFYADRTRTPYELGKRAGRADPRVRRWGA